MYPNVVLSRRGALGELKLRIIAQCDLAAKLCRDGRQSQARAARDKLLALLHQRDLLEGASA